MPNTLPSTIKVSWQIDYEGELDVSSFLRDYRSEWIKWVNDLGEDEEATDYDLHEFAEHILYERGIDISGMRIVHEEEPQNMEVW